MKLCVWGRFTVFPCLHRLTIQPICLYLRQTNVRGFPVAQIKSWIGYRYVDTEQDLFAFGRSVARQMVVTLKVLNMHDPHTKLDKRERWKMWYNCTFVPAGPWTMSRMTATTMMVILCVCDLTKTINRIVFVTPRDTHTLDSQAI